MKTVLITGSTSGIGLGIATEFAKTGKYNIIFNVFINCHFNFNCHFTKN